MSAERFARDKYVSLTTFRKDGTAVPTALWFAIDGDSLVAWTVTGSGKVKRIRRDGTSTVAACDMRGRVTGPPVDAESRICDAAETQLIRTLIARRYGIVGHITMAMSRLRRGTAGTVGIRVTLTHSSGGNQGENQV